VDVDTLRRILSVAAVLCCWGVSALPSRSAAVGRGRIAFADQGTIWTISPDGTGKELLTTTGHATFPAWSKDARRLAFIRGRSPRHELGSLYVINADGSGMERIVSGACRSPLWSPVRDEIAYLRENRDDETPGTDIAFVDARGRTTSRPFLH
jgi:Tol biopolymer transport system component